MGAIDRFFGYLDREGHGMVYDLAFALGWVGLISVLFSLIGGPQWIYYALLLGGIPAYFLFTFSWDLARKQQQERQNSG